MVGDVANTFYTVNPGAQASMRFALWGADFEASASAGGLAIFGDNTHDTAVRLTGVGPTGPAFRIADETRTVFADLGAAIEAKVGERVTFGTNFDTLLSGDQQVYSGGLSLSLSV